MKRTGGRHPALRLACAGLLGVSLLVGGCGAWRQGGFTPDQRQPHQYSFRVYVGGFSGDEAADEKAKEQIAEFMERHGYASYEIVDRRYNLVESYYEYVVRFAR